MIKIHAGVYGEGLAFPDYKLCCLKIVNHPTFEISELAEAAADDLREFDVEVDTEEVLFVATSTGGQRVLASTAVDVWERLVAANRQPPEVRAQLQRQHGLAGSVAGGLGFAIVIGMVILALGNNRSPGFSSWVLAAVATGLAYSAVANWSERVYRFVVLAMLSATLLGIYLSVAPLASKTTKKEAAGKQGQSRVYPRDLGAAWPLLADHAYLRCEPPRAAIAIVNGKSYALNGTAQGRGYPRIDPVWAPDPTTGAKKSISPLTKRALELCD